ncbi:MAG TPA: pantoate--beta-alanine ligase [Solirubrobacteraceae bacterium]|nr:pantoate--beta-alanine ligase [Solirubrobacteraceae bacterium]
MRTVTTVAALRAALDAERAAGRRIGLVPTMGALHDGHLSLIARAGQECDVVVASLFVNPTQFNDAADLDAYPRTVLQDARSAAAAGVDILFTPAAEEVYPHGFATQVVPGGVAERLEGAHRGRGHFIGVATVVVKLIGMAGPDVAYFGQKDAQQVAVIRRVVTDLNLRVAIAVCPTVRDADGLALSSRNARLSATDREAALSLSRALELTRDAVRDGEDDPVAATAAGRAAVAASGARLEYLELVGPDDLEPVPRIAGPVLAVIAAYVGTVRLIDNVLIDPAPGSRESILATATLGRC